MGRRRNRKRERRLDARSGSATPASLYEPTFDELLAQDELFFTLEAQRAQLLSPVLQCGTCREFVEDAEGGRGTCMHPGSGILSPWTDTPACPFHARGRR